MWPHGKKTLERGESLHTTQIVSLTASPGAALSARALRLLLPARGDLTRVGDLAFATLLLPLRGDLTERDLRRERLTDSVGTGAGASGAASATVAAAALSSPLLRRALLGFGLLALLLLPGVSGTLPGGLALPLCLSPAAVATPPLVAR